MSATATAPGSPAFLGPRRWNAAQSVALAVALAGAMLMASMASGLLFPIPYRLIGSHLYDLYAHALFVEGHWDLPMRDLKFEGHFTADGTGYLYYGLGPLITRLFFLPFVDMPTMWISAFSIWLWAVIGSAAYHRAFWLALAQGAGGADKIGGWASALLACGVWFASPGLLVAASGAVFDEPVAMAFALAGGFVLLIALTAFGRMPLERAVLPLAVLAGLTVHARPHLAVGLYVAVGLIALALVLRGGWRRWKVAVVAMSILGVFGLALVASNAVRFGNAATAHGGFGDEDVQYSSIFWGLESRDGLRAVAFRDFGQFNALRIVPNAIVYFASPPSNAGFDGAVVAIERLHASLLAPGDSVNYTQPRVGMAFLWAAWMLLMAVGLCQRTTWRMPIIAGLVGTAVSTVLVLSYLTVALRYRIDMWPMIALPAVFGLAAVARKGVADPVAARSWRNVLLLLATLGMFVTLQKTAHNRTMNTDKEDLWSHEYCMKLAAGKGFAPGRAEQICAKSSNVGAVR